MKIRRLSHIKQFRVEIGFRISARKSRERMSVGMLDHGVYSLWLSE